MASTNKRFARLTVIFLVISLVFVQTSCAFGAQSEASQSASAKSFSELKSTHWAYQSIQKLVSLGGIKGYPDGTFKPEGSITYAELCSILLGATGNDITVSEGNWAQGVLQKAYAAKIISSSVVPLGDANKAVTRDKMSMILSNSAGELRGEELVTLTDISKYVRDWSTISQAYQKYVNQCVAAGLIQGDTSNNFRATNKLTRAEASAICLRLIDASTRVTPEKFAGGGGTTTDGYTVVAQGTNISDYAKDPEWAALLTRPSTGTSDYKVLDNGSKFGITLVKKLDNWFMIQYTNPGKVILLDKDGNGIGGSQPHTIGDIVKQPFGVDLSQVKYFVFAGGSAEGWTNYIVPNTLQ